MFKYIFSFLVLVFVQQSLTAQVNWLNPKPSAGLCKKIVFIDSQNGFVINSAGDLFKTTNQGTSWEKVQNFFWASMMEAVDSTVIVASYNGIYRSVDKGSSWEKTNFVPGENIIGIDITSQDTIYMISSKKFYKSFDCALTWQVTAIGNTSITTMDFVDSKRGFIAKNNTPMLKTIDAGQTWQQVLGVGSSNTYFMTIKFLNADTGYGYRGNDSLYKTIDGGAHWQARFITWDIYSIQFPTASVGYLVGEYGVIYRTNDAGNTWTYFNFTGYALNNILFSAFFISPDIGFVVGMGGRISKTTNGGLSWQHNAFSYQGIRGLAFPTSQTAYATNWYNVYKTTNGGNKWDTLPLALPGSSSSNATFGKIHFFSADSGFLTADYPAKLYKTTNGGQTWKTINFAGIYSSTYDKHTGLSVLNDSVCFISMESYTHVYALYKTTDRGESWKKIDSTQVPDFVLRQIQFLDEKTGYGVAGYDLYKTTDSARTWVLLKTHYNYIDKIHFLDAKTGFIGDGDGVKRTSDSGRTFSAIAITGSIYGSAPSNFVFINKRVGYITSTYGTVFQTQDSGKSWLPYANTLYTADITAKYKDSVVYAGFSNGGIAAITVDTAYSAAAGCPGTSIIFVSDKSGSNYQWQVDTGTGFNNIVDDANCTGANTFQLGIHNTSGAVINYKYRCRADYGNNYSRIYDVHFKAKWTGAVNNDWDNAGNWSCGSIPDSHSDVTIESGNLMLQSSTTIRSLHISPGASLTVTQGNTLTILR